MRASVKGGRWADSSKRAAGAVAARVSRRAGFAAAVRRGAFVPPPTVAAATKPDLHFTQFTIAPSVTSTWNETDVVAAIVPGTTAASRVGNQIVVTGIRLRGIWAGGQSGTALDDPFNECRIVVALYKKTPGTTLFLGAAPILIHAPVDRQQTQGVIKVYLDKTIVLQSPGASGAGYQPSARYFDYFIPMSQRVSYSGSSVNLNSEQIVVSFISDSGTAPSPAVQSTCVVYFTP